MEKHSENKDLARANIKIQNFQERFSPEEGLLKGTVFPELYRPYYAGEDKECPEKNKKGGKHDVKR